MEAGKLLCKCLLCRWLGGMCLEPVEGGCMGTGSAAPLGGRGCSSPSAEGYSLSKQLCSQGRTSSHKARSFCLQSRMIFLFTSPTHTDAFSTSHLAGSDLRWLCAGSVFLQGHYFLPLQSEALLVFSSRPQDCGLLLSVAAAAVPLEHGFLVLTQP